MPPPQVSLHNTALMNMDKTPSPGFRKLNFLIQNPPFPPETFANLMLLYCKHQYYDLAADVLAENAHLTYEYLTGELYEFLDATLMVQVTAAPHTPSAPRHHRTPRRSLTPPFPR